MKSLFDEIVARGIPHEHHQSDLYIPYTPETQALVREFYQQGGSKASGFIHNETGEPWLDVPFAYDPFWRKEARREMRRPTNPK